MNNRVMRVRIFTLVALGAVAASSAEAQTTKRAQPATRIPVSKEPSSAPDTATAPAPAPTPAPAPVVETPAPATTMTTTTTTTTVQPRMRVRRYRSGMYMGIGGGASVPTGGIRDGYNTGYTVAVPIGWQPAESPLGFRVDFGYTHLDARNTFRNTGGPIGGPTGVGALALEDPQLWSALANLKLRLAHGWLGRSSNIYAVAGGGVNYFRHYNTTFARTNPEFNSTTTTTTSESLTRGAVDAGGGVSWGWHATEVFLESRYVTAFMPNERASYVPIILGVNFY